MGAERLRGDRGHSAAAADQPSGAHRDVAAWVAELVQRPAWQDDVRAFWTVYDAHFDEIVETNRRALGVQLEIGDLMRSLGPERLRQRAEEVRAAARSAAVAGDWGRYLEVLAVRAEEYAHREVSFASWFRSVTSWRSLLIPHLARAYANEPARFAAAIRGMDAYLDVTVATLGERYLLASQRQAEKRRDEAAGLADAARVLAEGTLARSAIQSILEAALRVVPSRVVAVMVPQDEGRTLEVVAVTGVDQDWVGRRYPVTEGITGRAFRTGEAQLVPDVRLDPDYMPWMEDIRSHLVVPLRAQGWTVGVLDLEAEEVGHFGEPELRLMEGFAAHAATALEMERLLRELTERERELRTALNEAEALALATRALAAETVAGDVLQGILAAALLAVPASHAILVVADRDTRNLKVAAVVGAPAEWIGRRDGLAEGITGRAFSTREVQLVRDTRDDPDYGEWVPGVRSELAVPILSHGEAVGVINLESSEVAHFGPRDAYVLRSFAEYAAIALENERLLRAQRDLEELARQQAVLEDANRAKSAFLANMSHELRTPLHAVIGFTGLLEEQLAASISAQQQRYLSNVRKAGEHLMALIGDVLDIARIEAGKLDFHREEVALSVLLEPVIAAGALSARSKGVRFDAAAASPATLRVDPARLRQVLYNLVSNAVKFTPTGGRVALDTTVEGDGVRFTVADSGIGIPAEQHGRVFGVFERLHEGKVEASGTGLGLALTKRLVELHGGTITFESAEGAGTTFRVWIPEVIVSELPPDGGR